MANGRSRTSRDDAGENRCTRTHPTNTRQPHRETSGRSISQSAHPVVSHAQASAAEVRIPVDESVAITHHPFWNPAGRPHLPDTTLAKAHAGTATYATPGVDHWSIAGSVRRSRPTWESPRPQKSSQSGFESQERHGHRTRRDVTMATRRYQSVRDGATRCRSMGNAASDHHPALQLHSACSRLMPKPAMKGDHRVDSVQPRNTTSSQVAEDDPRPVARRTSNGRPGRHQIRPQKPRVASR